MLEVAPDKTISDIFPLIHRCMHSIESTVLLQLKAIIPKAVLVPLLSESFYLYLSCAELLNLPVSDGECKILIF